MGLGETTVQSLAAPRLLDEMRWMPWTVPEAAEVVDHDNIEVVDHDDLEVVDHDDLEAVDHDDLEGGEILVLSNGS